MPPQARRWLFTLVVATVLVYVLYNLADRRRTDAHLGGKSPAKDSDNSHFQWKTIPQRYPVPSMLPLPSGRPIQIPRIQHERKNGEETWEARVERERRLGSVKENFAHAWNGYKKYAWLKDELSPVSGGSRDVFGGWAATLVDSLDTLWIMGFGDEFDAAVADVVKIDFSSSTEAELNVFETTIRYLGGFLSAYDLSGREILLEKALELGDMLYVAFDTPNRMPVTRWKWKAALKGKAQEAGEQTLVAEVGSLSLEFTRLSQLSGDPKYFDAIERITKQFIVQQNMTKLPGMWPVILNAKEARLTDDNTFTLGAMSDSLYEYLPKQYMLLGGLQQEYRSMYEDAIETAKKHLFFQPMNKDNLNILISGSIQVNKGRKDLDSQGQHLVCFAGGMMGIGAKIFDRDDLSVARKLVDGCIWAYASMPSGIMPETFHALPCDIDCQWDRGKWQQAVLDRDPNFMGAAADLTNGRRLPLGFTNIGDRRYILRPEAIESIFVLYRITGDKTLQDKAWTIFQAIEKHTRTDIAHAALDDVTLSTPPKSDRMESFWTAETLKYFFLIFSDPDLISLDDYVFNTEAHPFKRPNQRKA